MESEREKIKQTRKLMFEVTQERRRRFDAKVANDLCQCGHKRKHHLESHSINYTEGFCTKCKCEYFIMYKELGMFV